MSCTPKSKRALGGAVSLACAVFVLAACQAEPELTPDEAVHERAQERWDLRLEQEYGEAYEYYSPGYRQTVDAYSHVADQRNRAVMYTGARVVSVECESEICRARVRVEYRVPGAPSGLSRVTSERTITENWIHSGGEWWYSPSR
ncbi:hypothetical protein IC757_02515 [Wenzhouxiangella sp. AB-CW3]|uniref:hypothetical protein n=1 Tax=Wenzhouxiangella sp. AB-CW3 TaxID=2771012 RepID=UPI00168AF709|nr:hypothetical protein [Wenzhouxiangella sp. AB-CW3]QOC23051.1 hypothetical protein IC757_02515 [Wenzhouxiangella sp. AB-CW3]